MTKSLEKLLAEYEPEASEEIESKAKILKFLQTHQQNAFNRENEIGHITASGFLLNKNATKALLTHHAKLDEWIQLGGHCDGNANVLEVAIKELIEESGINSIEPISKKIFDIDIHQIPKWQNIPAHLHFDIRFLFKVTSNEQIKKNHESKELKWFKNKPNLLPTRSESILRMFRKWS